MNMIDGCGFSIGHQITNLVFFMYKIAVEYYVLDFCSSTKPDHCWSKKVFVDMIMLYFLGPSPPLNITVVKQDLSFASVKWTAPNDPNKDSYTYRVMWYLRRDSMNYKTVYNTEINITRLVPGGNYTLTVTSYYNNTYSLPETITFIAGIVQFDPLHKIIERTALSQTWNIFKNTF